MTDHGAPFFIALPDRDEVGAVVRRLRAEDPGLSQLDHPSGRPWILGRWGEGELAVARAGRDAVALIGTLPPLRDELQRWVGGLNGDARRVEGLSTSLAGDFHVLGSVDGALYVQGTAYGTRRVYHARAEGALVASDRALRLAELTGARLDAGALAWKLLQPLPAQLNERTMWHEVRAVQPGWYLLASADGAPSRHVRWHRPAEPHLGLAEGARLVREALVAAVGARTHRGGVISSDLSGGLDSTSLSSIAAGQLGPGELVVCTNGGDESINEDGHWARVAASHWPHVEHYQLPPEEQPLFYSGALDEGCRSDFPGIISVSRKRATILISRMAERGSRLHLGGHGGDHLFFSSGTHYHGLLPRRPILSLQRIRAYGILYGWSGSAVLRQLLDRRSYRSALARIDLDHSGDLGFSTPGLTWVRRPVVPSWLTDDCRELLAEELRKAVAQAEPRGDTIGRHMELDNILTTTLETGSIGDAARRAGVPMSTPYFDDAVVDAALAVRVEDRATPYEYKPLLMEAVRGILPDACRARTTKGEGTFDAVGGLYRHRQELIDLWQDSALAKAGLIDAEAVSRKCSTPGTPELRDGGINSTLICETWLRAVQ
ncbi:asparagine synthase-related protein [Streptomyces sp. TP-A0874]|uniref:asparagine synthase-related protein n=1 Tax=Streptomyces sp. TP-A0874 TaxID=549819 RepID=UPI000AF34E38|nr:asparagine synthase-related protein [Streptomyces sp. TP-A0874]